MMAQVLVSEGWQAVSDKEELEAANTARLSGRVFNGCIEFFLKERFGPEQVKHVMGIGWFRQSDVGGGI